MPGEEDQVVEPNSAARREETLRSLRELELKLRSTEVQMQVAGRDLPERRQFVEDLQKISVSIREIENARLSEIAHRLQAFDDDLKSGIRELRTSLDEANRMVAALQTFTRVVNIATRVAGLAV
jgi:hypothetical protein